MQFGRQEKKGEKVDFDDRDYIVCTKHKAHTKRDRNDEAKRRSYLCMTSID